MVAALEAINGINLFGARGGPSSVIHVLHDEIIRNYITLYTALPFESPSKEVDGAILSVIGFPAFAIHDPDKIRRKIWHEEVFKRWAPNCLGKYQQVDFCFSYLKTTL